MKLKDIIKTDKIIRASSGSTLSSAVGQLSSSHDAAFIFDDHDQFLGVVNPYYCLIKSSLPGNAKLQQCLFHPPHIQLHDPIGRVAQLMNESKIHYLPVFDDGNRFQGIISARRLIASTMHLPLFRLSIGEVLQSKTRPLVTIREDDTIAHAMHLFKTQKVSKLIVVNTDMKLKGVIAYYDLISYLITPKEKERRGGREGVKDSFLNLRVKNFAKRYVLTLNSNRSLHEALDLILEKKIGSVIVVDAENNPTGIITTGDFLRLLRRHEHERRLEVTVKNVSRENRRILSGFFDQLMGGIKRLPDIVKARLFVKEEKQGHLFKVVLSLFPKKGKLKIIEEEGKNLREVLTHVKKEEREIER